MKWTALGSAYKEHHNLEKEKDLHGIFTLGEETIKHQKEIDDLKQKIASKEHLIETNTQTEKNLTQDIAEIWSSIEEKCWGMKIKYFRLYNYYQELFTKNSNTPFPSSPELREKLILESYFEDIPDSFDTNEGNDLLNIFLDAVDMLEAQLKIKLENGKLDSIVDKK